MNKEFNTIAKIQEDATIINRGAAYLHACDQFEAQASQYANNSNWLCRKYAEEVSICYNKVKNCNCEYTAYANAHAAEVWLSKACDSAD